MKPNARVIEGDCLKVMAEMDAESVDAIVTDPPYPYVNRKYGKWTEETWRSLMDTVVDEAKRILKPHGSMVAVVQPNSEKLGHLRPWMFRWMADMASMEDGWGIVQDVWWWNHTAPPTAHTNRKYGLCRPSLKACVWIGRPDCFRNQDSVLWEPSEGARAMKSDGRAFRTHSPSGHSVDKSAFVKSLNDRGGVTPFNLIPCSATTDPHGAGTPMRLLDWWCRYICPPSGHVMDPFSGHATTGLAAIQNGMSYTGIERCPDYAETSRQRLEGAPNG